LQIRAWIDAGYPFKTMVVNISGRQLLQEGFAKEFFSILEAAGADPESLELDATENVLVRQPEAVASVLKKLKDRGVRICVDNFGTVDASLLSLRKLPLDAIKIDRSLVGTLVGSPTVTELVSAMIGAGKKMNLRVIAHGVETRKALEFLKTQGCDEAQGHFFSPPEPPEYFTGQLYDSSSAA